MRLPKPNKSWLIVSGAIALLTASVCLVVLTVLTAELLLSAQPILKDIKTTTGQIKATAYEIQNFTKFQKAQIQDAGYERKLSETVLLTNSLLADAQRRTLPRVNGTLDGLTETTRALQAAIWETKAAMAVNSGHVSELLVEAKGVTSEFRATAKGLNELAAALGVEVPALAGEFTKLISAGTASAEQVNRLLADPKLPELLAQAERLVRETGDIAVNLDAATAELPPMVKTARRWQTPLNLARLLSVLVGLL